ncbi:hypothetical protein FJZ19_02520 [Candidatus Pacearchaeota archaeon]|nr:hypothetical protein [Candidatus Pacearchaeota archaeon]
MTRKNLIQRLKNTGRIAACFAGLGVFVAYDFVLHMFYHISGIDHYYDGDHDLVQNSFSPGAMPHDASY